jgi:hypothetical protein
MTLSVASHAVANTTPLPSAGRCALTALTKEASSAAMRAGEDGVCAWCGAAAAGGAAAAAGDDDDDDDGVVEEKARAGAAKEARAGVAETR